MKISFIIPHKGREEMLIKTLQSIFQQDYDQNELEIFIITQNLELKQTVELISQRRNVTILYHDSANTIAKLRNEGAKRANGQYLAFIDADVHLSPNWVYQVRHDLHARQNRIISSCIQACEKSAKPLEQLRTALSNFYVDCECHFLPGRNLFLTTTNFEKIGGFPEHLETCEDYYFTDKAAQLGSLFYSSKASYIHLGEDKSYKELFFKEIWRAKSNLKSLFGRSFNLSEIPSWLAPIGFFIIIMCLSISLFTSLNTLTWLSLLVIPISIYAIRGYCLAKRKIGLNQWFIFYLVYLPARSIGTIWGLFKVLRR
ncbi:glycosyltransferase family A protein [Thalassotalea psychrophila]|uniref:Glycosyltransferase family A protein n=1 Tax=Thalassotalea psychrophila TaxID=3065647 RepID=A0ABY9TUU6_9GAMM|nr:glycosyltransferase family A protein [Colwelliaceae bacterium SQ149]